MSRSFIKTIFVATIFFTTKLLAPILGEKLAGVVAGMIVNWRMVVNVGRDGVLLDLILARLIPSHSGQVVGYGFFFVEPDLAGVGADKTFVEDAARELVEVLVFEGA